MEADWAKKFTEDEVKYIKNGKQEGRHKIFCLSGRIFHRGDDAPVLFFKSDVEYCSLSEKWNF
ncbi:hypothetical protein RDT67_26125 [Serratia fonticola]|uniref:Uncharacterized protein n=1 Tax=Serratia fonticola TaxID=47917 RepID=A0AAJ1YGI0_SERFO|nr:hypothetical protein [Serratia fonticola]MDQ9129885.1 hypothetical protein [Serratia fonticola]